MNEPARSTGTGGSDIAATPASATELPERGLREFAATLAAHGAVWIDTRALWAAFSAAFPRHPAGAQQREWLLSALASAERAGVIELPAPGSARWDRLALPAVPTAVRRVRVAPALAPETWRTAVWHPALQWVPSMGRLNAEEASFLRRVHDGLVAGSFATPAPLKHRSLALTGYEKRLGDLTGGRLFGPGKLSLALLGAEREVPPLAWTVIRPAVAPRVLVFENAGPSDLAVALLQAMAVPSYDVVVFGGGKPFPSSVVRLVTLRPSVIAYVGDLDPEGLAIATSATVTTAVADLPTLIPAPRMHAAMLAGAHALGHPDGWPIDEKKVAGRRSGPNARAMSEWLSGDVRAAVIRIVAQGRRIPEEVLSPQAMNVVLCAAPMP